MKSNKQNKIVALGQGTIEYLVILAIIVGIGLVVVSILSGFTSQSSNISQSQTQLDSGSQTIALSEAITGTDNNTTLLKLKSMSGDIITITKIEADGSTNFVGRQLTPGGELTIGIEELTENCSCVGVPVGTNKPCQFTITYTTLSGLEQKQITTTNTQCTGTVTPTNPTQVLGLGIGTLADPYVITSCTELQNTQNKPDANYALGANLDCNETLTWDYNSETEYYQGFTPIGNSTTKFSGSFNGRNYTISNLYIYRPNTSYVGLFGYVNSITTDINNLGMIDSNITGYSQVGGISGKYGFINNCYNTGTITGISYTAGIIGQYGTVNYSHNSGTINGLGDSTTKYYTAGIIGRNGTVNYSYNEGTIYSTGRYCGGINGANGTVNNSYNTGLIDGRQNYVGGIMGGLGTVNNSYNTGRINPNGTSYFGGIMGAGGNITNSYNTGDVGAAGMSIDGGLIGSHGSTNTIINSFSTGSVWGYSNTRGAVGLLSAGGTVINLYWYDSSGSDNATTCYGTDTNCTKLTSIDYNLLFDPTTDLYDTVEPYWTFGVDGNWTARDNNYPILTWQVE